MLAEIAFLLAQKVICIDPGHPSEVGVGTRGKRATEVTVAWTVAIGLKKQLEARGYRVAMTKRAENQKVLNKTRAEIANLARASLMIRLHCDASSGSGFTVYYPARQGSSGGLTGPSKSVLDASHAAAITLHHSLHVSLLSKLADGGLKTDLATAVGAKQGALTGSIYSKVPVVLVEMVVLTNPKDEAFILSKAGRNLMVRALADAVAETVK